MIGTRGPNNTPVLERNVVPLRDICEAIVLKDRITAIENRFAITKDELIYCAQSFLENYGPSKDDFIELECNTESGVFEVITAGVSDWVFIDVIMAGIQTSEEDVINMIFAHGLQCFMKECLIHFKQYGTVEDLGFTHQLIFNNFQECCKPVTHENVDELLDSLEVDEL